jgi:GNAT superfamily N-acetyltransferase
MAGVALAVTVRAPRQGDGTAVAALWKNLWDLHASWGGYPGSATPLVYERLAAKLDQDFYHRRELIAEGSHLHIVAANVAGEIVGQVEGWLERYGERADTAFTCEVRSLIVAEHYRGQSVGALLLSKLAQIAKSIANTKVVLVAEVLSQNPAHAFYARQGFTSLSTTLKFDAPPKEGRGKDVASFRARPAEARDAFALALLDAQLARERRARSDIRFDGPTAIDAARVAAIATHLRSPDPFPTDLVIQDNENVLFGAASLALMALDPPFVPVRRAALGRIILTPSASPKDALCALLRAAYAEADSRGARFLEVTDLSAHGMGTLNLAISLGGSSWSEIVAKVV